MSVRVTIPPLSTQLTTVMRVKEEIFVSTSNLTHDYYISWLIDEASETIARWAGRPLWRAQFKETRHGNDLNSMQLSRFPLAGLDSVTLDGAAITDVTVEDPQWGLLHRAAGFLTRGQPAEWSFTYTAGFFVTHDDFSGQISVNGTDNSYNSAGGEFPQLLRAGDFFYASLFLNTQNVGYKEILSATPFKLVVNDTLVTEPVRNGMLGLRNLPGYVERGVQTLVQQSYHTRDRDPALTAASIGPTSFTWAEGAAGQTEAIRRSIQAMALPL